MPPSLESNGAQCLAQVHPSCLKSSATINVDQTSPSSTLSSYIKPVKSFPSSAAIETIELL